MIIKNRKIICILLSMTLVITSSACKKNEAQTKEISPCVEQAETVLDTMISLNAKKLKKLGDFPDEMLEVITQYNDKGLSKALALCSYEIDESSVKEKTKTASCSATVTQPDFSRAAKEFDIDYSSDLDKFFSDYTKAIKKQDTKYYKDIEIKLEFDIMNDEYTLSNGKEVSSKFYDPFSTALLGLLEDIQENASTTTTETTKTTKSTCVELNEEVFTSVLKKTDPEAGEKIRSSDVTQMDGNFTKYLMASSTNIMYVYNEFATSSEAREQFSIMSTMAEDIGPYYVLKSDWGFSVWQYDTATFLAYYSGKAL